jgi:hypothetical protein
MVATVIATDKEGPAITEAIALDGEVWVEDSGIIEEGGIDEAVSPAAL